MELFKFFFVCLRNKLSYKDKISEDGRNMAQFIQYLYEYENGQRVRNLGFMKVDKQMDKTVIQIYAKQLDEVTGIQFQRENGSRYVATWENEEENAQEMQQPAEQKPATQRPAEQMESTQRPAEQIMPSSRSSEQMESTQGSTVQTMPSSQPSEQMEPVQRSQERTMSPSQPSEQMRPTQWPLEQLQPTQEEEEEVSAYIPPNSRRCEKIQRQDLSRLPRREWRLANNSFLLHGFYNYHHLLYIEDDGKTWIGVPGVYHEKERAAATAFGFPEFQRLTDMELELSEEEKNTYEDFGYWCRQVER